MFPKIKITDWNLLGLLNVSAIHWGTAKGTKIKCNCKVSKEKKLSCHNTSLMRFDDRVDLDYWLNKYIEGRNMFGLGTILSQSSELFGSTHK